MKKIITILATFMLTTMSINLAKAEGPTIGFSASYTMINASGTETESTETTNASVSNDVAIGSIFVENNFGSFSLGLDYIPFKADVSSKTKSRADSNTEGDTGTNTAQAEISNHITVYTIVPFGNGMFVKAGVAQVDVNTKESLNSGSTYGDDTIYGGQIGFGFLNDNWRLALEYTDYEQVSLTSQTNSDNKVTADLDTTAIKLSFNF